MTISSLEALRTTWQHLSTRNDWALVTDEESFLRHATEELNNLQDIRSPEQRMRMALTRAYSTLLYEQLWERRDRAAHEVWLASYRFALRDRFNKDDAEALAQEAVSITLEKLDTLKSPASLLFWITRVYNTARSKSSKQTPSELPLAESEENEPTAFIDYNNRIIEAEKNIELQYLFNTIRRFISNDIELTAMIRCVLKGEHEHHVAYDLGLLDYRVRVAKSRALQRLRKDPHFMSALKELVGDSRIFDAEDDYQPHP